MSEGISLRAQMDAETARALLLINGGGALSLLTLFANVTGKPCAASLASPILIGVMLMVVGLVFGVMHNRYRRYCSLHYQRHGYRPPKGVLFGITLPEPTVCFAGTTFLWLSLACFLVGGAFVAYKGMANLNCLAG